MENPITIQVTVKADLATTWNAWTQPEHIINWNFASPEWHCPAAENILEPNGIFSWRMEAKDGSMGFDFRGTYVQIIPHEEIDLVLDDGRKANVSFQENAEGIAVTQTFEPDENDPELQRQGWQAILDNFKRYLEAR